MRKHCQPIISRDGGNGNYEKNRAGEEPAFYTGAGPYTVRHLCGGLGLGACSLMLLGLGFTGCPGRGGDQAGDEHTAAEAK